MLGNLPCMSEFYIGSTNYIKNKCIEKKKCKYLNGMQSFIQSEYPDYQVIRCCDIESSSIAQLEALLTNRNDPNDILAIEMKCIPQNLFHSVSETNKNNRMETYFWNRIIDGCTYEAKEKLISAYQVRMN